MSLRTIKRRRRENKTDYKLRFSSLKSNKVRIIIRRTNRYFIVQAVESKEAQDKVIAGVTSKNLLKFGWPEESGSLKSIPAGYLTGLLIAKKLGNKGEYNVDIGMARKAYKGRIFSVVAGLIDGGLKINASKDVLPSKDMIEGKNSKPEIQKIIKSVKEKIGGKK